MREIVTGILIISAVVTCSVVVTDSHAEEELIGPPDYQAPLNRLCIRGNSINHSFGKVRNNGTKNHQGHDYVAKVNTPIYSIANGKVVRVTHKGAHGLSVVISVENFYVRYSHLSSLVVSPNDEVYHGEVVGFTGRSGNARNVEPHLHFELLTEKQPGYGLKGRKSPIELFPHLRKFMFDC
uniref:M23ase beta-sheet core domain-containing protein n=1 Tax=viral metagenome TaxID=1070528 RepID=A0A2V0RAH3_9ZZZZ